MRNERYFLCPSCNKKLVCDIICRENDEFTVVLKCTNSYCGYSSHIEFTNPQNKRSRLSDHNKKKAVYDLVGSHLKYLRKKMRHSDFHEDEIPGLFDKQISMFDKNGKIKEIKNG